MMRAFHSPCSQDIPLIRLENVTVTRGGKHLLKDVGWSLRRGEHWAVFGRNGAGKSTFLRVLRGDMPPDRDGVREYCFDGEPSASPLGLRQRIGLVSPELQARYVRQAWKIDGREVVLAGFFDTPFLYEVPSPAQRAAADAILRELGVTRLAERPVKSMSTGELRTILFARALVVQPEVLVLDECLDGLDASALPGMLSIIDRAASMTTIVCTAHRMDQVPSIIARSMLIREGEIVLSGDGKALRAEIETELFEDVRADAADAREAGEMALACPPDEEPGQSDSLVRLSGVNVVVDGVPILQNVDWEIRSGENWAVVGRNGAGKTSLLRVLCGDLPALAGGEVAWFGQCGVQDVTEVRRKVGLVSDRLQALYEYDLTAHQLVLSGFFGSIGLYEDVSDAQRRAASHLMGALGLGDLESRAISSLSYGQLRKALIARALVPGARLLLLDEPLSGLDPASRSDILTLLRRLPGIGISLVYVTHHEDELLPVFDHLLVLDGGRVVFNGPRTVVRSADRGFGIDPELDPSLEPEFDAK